jgi:hypothetical protein
MFDEALLRDKARAALKDGRLPPRKPSHTWGGPGVGIACAVCELPITQAELEIEVAFLRDATAHLHIACFTAWEFERQDAASQESPVNDEAARFVTALMDTRLCLRCVAIKSEIPEERLVAVIRNIQRTVTVNDRLDLCDSCGCRTIVYKLG